MTLSFLAAIARARSFASTARDELAKDPSNWFAPTVEALEDWCISAGFEIERMGAWPERRPARAMLRARPDAGPAEYEKLSYERPLRCISA